MMRIVIGLAVVMFAMTAATAEPKGKGRATCESIKSYAVCNTMAGCGWVPVGQSKNFKCRTLKATPR
jgi:hypothetical protein